MKPVSLKLKKRSEDAPMPSKMYDGPEYPYGTRIELDLKTIKAMGLKIEDFTVGTELDICGCVEVTSVSQNSSTDSEMRGSISLQIKTLALEEGDDKENLSKKLRDVLKKSRGESTDDGGEGGEGDD